ncbi:MAG: S-layer homology domain-containing protein [Oscillospiraceae bacterium]
MKRKILSLILVFAMTVSLLTVGTGAVEPTYGDTAGHWAESSIERWSGHGIIQGSNGLFDPNGQLTCAQLATILAKLLKLPAAKDAGFTDNTADAWYYDAINRCAAAGILNGNGDGTVTPDAPISRERAIVMLGRALGIEPIREPDLTKYTDAAKVAPYAQGMVAAMIEAGIVGGVTADELAPQDNITRAATVTILDRAIDTYADEAGATVKADGKGIVLVVAKNVKITGAPEGTKIVVADGATGLTVNGKSVSDDQTYIVPKTTTSSGSSSGGYSHSHTWVDNYCNGCGQFKDTVVAAIGKKGYETLEAAINAAQSGDTVKLMKDITLAQRVEASFNGTIDLNGRTLTSTETCKNGSVFHVASGTLTIKNGSMIGVSGPTGWTDELYKKECDAITVANGATVTLEDLSISICSRTGACVYVFDGGKAYITSGTYINDTTEFDANGTTKAMLLNQADNKPQAIFVSGGTFKGENPANGDNSHNPSTFLAAGYKAEGADNIWTVSEDTSKTYCAQVGNGKYETLAAAIEAAQNGDTVKLLNNEVVSATVTVDKNLTLDLGGNTLTGTNCRALHITSGKLELTGTGTVKSTGIAVNSSVVRVGDDSGEERNVELVIGKDVVIESPNSYGVGAFGTVTTEKLTIYGTIKSTATTNESYDGCAVTTLGTDTSTPATIIIKGGAKISATNTNAIYLPAGTLSVEGGEITGTTGIYFKSTNMTISGGTITGNGAQHNYQEYHNGGISTGEAVTIDSCNYPGGIDSVSISGGEFSSTHANAIGSYNSNNGLLQTNFVTGGMFSSNPSAYVAEGYFSLPNENSTYTVVTADQITSGVTIQGIAGYEHRAFATVEDAFTTVKTDLEARCGLVEQPMDEAQFNAFFTDGGKITWTIYGEQAVTDNRTFSFGRAANRFGEGRHITEINIIGGNDTAALNLSAVNGTFALPYNWWNVADSANTALKCKNIKFNGIKSMPSGIYQCTLHPTTYEFDGCTFNGNLYSYQNFDVVMTIKNSTFNAPDTTTQYAFMSQGKGGTITLNGNTFNGYTRGVNLERGTANFVFTNNTITSTVSEPDRAAIQLTDGKSFTVTGNTVRVNAGNAFWFHEAAKNSDVEYTISGNDIDAPYIGYYATSFDVNPKITSSGNKFNNTDTTKCMKKGATVAEATNLTAIH